MIIYDETEDSYTAEEEREMDDLQDDLETWDEDDDLPYVVNDEY
jgi:hypothetical protein